MNNLNFIKRSSETLETGSMYGQFLITNLLKGQAMTVANALRRVLLNDFELNKVLYFCRVIKFKN